MNFKKLFHLLSFNLLTFSAFSAEPLSPAQAAIEQFKTCVQTALANGATAEQIANVCEAEKAALDQQLPDLSDQMQMFLLAGSQ